MNHLFWSQEHDLSVLFFKTVFIHVLYIMSALKWSQCWTDFLQIWYRLYINFFNKLEEFIGYRIPLIFTRFRGGWRGEAKILGLGPQRSRVKLYGNFKPILVIL